MLANSEDFQDQRGQELILDMFPFPYPQSRYPSSTVPDAV